MSEVVKIGEENIVLAVSDVFRGMVEAISDGTGGQALGAVGTKNFLNTSNVLINVVSVGSNVVTAIGDNKKSLEVARVFVNDTTKIGISSFAGIAGTVAFAWTGPDHRPF